MKKNVGIRARITQCTLKLMTTDQLIPLILPSPHNLQTAASQLFYLSYSKEKYITISGRHALDASQSSWDKLTRQRQKKKQPHTKCSAEVTECRRAFFLFAATASIITSLEVTIGNDSGRRISVYQTKYIFFKNFGIVLMTICYHKQPRGSDIIMFIQILLIIIFA